MIIYIKALYIPSTWKKIQVINTSALLLPHFYGSVESNHMPYIPERTVKFISTHYLVNLISSSMTSNSISLLPTHCWSLLIVFVRKTISQLTLMVQIVILTQNFSSENLGGTPWTDPWNTFSSILPGKSPIYLKTEMELQPSCDSPSPVIFFYLHFLLLIEGYISTAIIL